MMVTAPVVAQTTYVRRPLPVAAQSAPLAARIASPGDEMQQAVRQNWRGGLWLDTTRNRYTRYDAAHNNLERIVEDIDAGGAWARRNRRTNVYNAQNQRVIDTIFSNLNNPLFAFTRTYTAAGKPSVLLVKLRFGAVWRDVSRDTYEYDANGFPVSLLQENNSGGWYNFARYLYTTDAQGRITYDSEERYNDNTGAWEPSSELAYTYTANDSIATAVYSEVDATTGSLFIVGRSSYRYTAGGLLDSIYNEPYDLVTSSYSLGSLATYTYDARANRTSEVIKIGSSLTALTNISRWLYTYLPTGLADDVLVGTTLAVAPNPTNSGRAELHFALAKAAPVAVEVLDLLGRRVAQPLAATARTAGQHTVGLDVRGLSAGLYLVRLTAAGASRQVKLVVE